MRVAVSFVAGVAIGILVGKRISSHVGDGATATPIFSYRVYRTVGGGLTTASATTANAIPNITDNSWGVYGDR